MTTTTTKKKPLRFAAFIRVSTDRQELQGESLRSQRTQNQRDVDLLGGIITGWYGGQEHATPGWEKQEQDRLLQDAAKGKFDAIIVSHHDRWTRDEERSAYGRKLFKKHGIRFFVSVTESDLFNPEHVLMADQQAIMGKYFAAN